MTTVDPGRRSRKYFMGDGSPVYKPVDPGAVATNASPYNIVRTSPEHIVRHDISDEEMTVLTNDQSGTILKDIFMAALGAVVGAFVPGLQAIVTQVMAPEKFGVLDLLVACLLVSSFVAVCITGFLLKRAPTTDRSAALAKAIRERTAKSIENGA